MKNYKLEILAFTDDKVQTTSGTFLQEKNILLGFSSIVHDKGMRYNPALVFRFFENNLYSIHILSFFGYIVFGTTDIHGSYKSYDREDEVELNRYKLILKNLLKSNYL